jgi:glucose 1-dehydrogenase
VVVNYVIDPQAAEDVAHEIESYGRRAIVLKADVSIEGEAAEMFAIAIEHFKTRHLLVSDAGLQRDAPYDQLTPERWNTVINVNLTGQFLSTRAATREFKRRGVIESVSVAAGKNYLHDPCINDIAQAAVWLASDAADYVIGATLFADCGMPLYHGFGTGG